LQHLKETHGFFQELKILPYNKLSKWVLWTGI
jgi:hypothetical protein